MAVLTVHDLAFRIPASRALHAGDVDYLGSRELEVDLAEALRVNALAIPYRGPLLMRLVQRELALVLSLFQRAAPGRPLTRHPAYDSASSHIRRFATEVTGLGILNSIVTDLYGQASLAHYDALPAHLHGLYPHGTRPDLRFAQAGSVLAGEARGRNAPPPTRVKFRSQEIHRLAELVAWSQLADCDPVCMTWAWMQRAGTSVNHYFEVPNASGRSDGFGDAGSGLEELYGADWDEELTLSRPEESALSRPDVWDEREDVVMAERARTVEERTLQAEAELVESAPRQRVPGMDELWFGEWVEVPTYDDESSVRMLLAAAPQRRTRKRSAEAQRVKRQQSIYSEMEVSVEGNLMVAVDWSGRPPVESGPLVSELARLDADLSPE